MSDHGTLDGLLEFNLAAADAGQGADLLARLRVPQADGPTPPAGAAQAEGASAGWLPPEAPSLRATCG